VSTADETTRVYRRKLDQINPPVRVPRLLNYDDLIDDQARDDENYNAGIHLSIALARRLGYHDLVARLVSSLRHIPS